MGKGQEGALEAATVLGLHLGGGHTGIIRGQNPSSCTCGVSSFHCAILEEAREHVREMGSILPTAPGCSESSITEEKMSSP